MRPDLTSRAHARTRSPWVSNSSPREFSPGGSAVQNDIPSSAARWRVTTTANMHTQIFKLVFSPPRRLYQALKAGVNRTKVPPKQHANATTHWLQLQSTPRSGPALLHCGVGPPRFRFGDV